MKSLFFFVALISMALAANIDSAKPDYAVYSSPDTHPGTISVTLPQALAILCNELPGSSQSCSSYCYEHFNPTTICSGLCNIYREHCA